MNQLQYNTPNTRARVAARRDARRKRGQRSDSGSMVRPGLRRVLGQWLVTGRLFSLAVLAAALTALGVLFTSPSYTVRQVEVHGNSALDGGAVAELAGVRGTPVWFINERLAAQRLLASAYVDQAHVEVALPDRVVITLVERRPDVRWQLGGMQYLVDATGKVLDVAAEPATPGTLVIEDASCRAGAPCQPLQANGQVDPDALELARRLSLRLPADLQLAPASIGWDIGLGVFITTAERQTIVFGQTDNLERKFAVLGYLLSDKTRFTYLDLRPSNPFYRDASQPAPTPAADGPQ